MERGKSLKNTTLSNWDCCSGTCIRQTYCSHVPGSRANNIDSFLQNTNLQHKVTQKKVQGAQILEEASYHLIKAKLKRAKNYSCSISGTFESSSIGPRRILGGLPAPICDAIEIHCHRTTVRLGSWDWVEARAEERTRSRASIHHSGRLREATSGGRVRVLIVAHAHF